jgi:hypothetical protein
MMTTNMLRRSAAVATAVLMAACEAAEPTPEATVRFTNNSPQRIVAILANPCGLVYDGTEINRIASPLNPGASATWQTVPDCYEITAATETEGIFQSQVTVGTGETPVSITQTLTASVSTGGTAQSATIGFPVATAPAIRVLNGAGGGVPSLDVRFSTTNPGATVTGAAGSTPAAQVVVRTNAQGIASVSGWRLGSAVGAQTLTATVVVPGTVTGNNIAFSATATAPVLTATTALATTGLANGNTTASPTIRVTSAGGANLAGVPVTFTIGAGSGAVTAGTTTASTVTVNSDATGLASLASWRLGTAAGANTVVASSPTATNVTFSSCGRTAYTIGASVAGTQTATDCVPATGFFEDLFQFTNATGTRYQGWTLNPATAAVRFFVYPLGSELTPGGWISTAPVGTTTTSALLVGPGTHLIGVRNDVAGAASSYALGSQDNLTEGTGCFGTIVLVGTGITRNRSLSAGNCTMTTNGLTYYYQPLWVYAIQGQTYTITMSGTAFDEYLDVYQQNAAGVMVPIGADNDGVLGTNDARLTVSVPATGWYEIRPNSNFALATGAYTISMTATAPPANVQAAGAGVGELRQSLTGTPGLPRR